MTQIKKEKKIESLSQNAKEAFDQLATLAKGKKRLGLAQNAKEAFDQLAILEISIKKLFQITNKSRINSETDNSPEHKQINQELLLALCKLRNVLLLVSQDENLEDHQISQFGLRIKNLEKILRLDFNPSAGYGKHTAWTVSQAYISIDLLSELGLLIKDDSEDYKDPFQDLREELIAIYYLSSNRSYERNIKQMLYSYLKIFSCGALLALAAYISAKGF